MAYEYIHKPKVRYVHISAYDKLGGELLENYSYKDLPLRMAIKWGWFFKYRHALLQVKYPKGYINTSHHNVTPEGRSLDRIEQDRIKKEMTTCKRMITKITNAINEFEIAERKTLIPNWEDPRYIRTKSKLNDYKKRLNQLQKVKK